MKKSDEIRRKTWRMIAKNLIVLAALAVAAVIGVMSWFTKDTTATADGISMSCECPPGIEIAIVNPSLSSDDVGDYLNDNGNWFSGTINLTAENYDFLKNLYLCEVTGDGNTFSLPVLTQSNGIASVDTSKDWGDPPTPNDEYLSFYLAVRGKVNNTVVKLAANTKIAPVSSTIVSGNSYSADAAVGAVRFSVVDISGSTDVTKLLWIPAPHIYYNFDTATSTGTVVDNVLANNTSMGPYYLNGDDILQHQDGTYVHAYYDTTKTRQKISTSNQTTTFVANNTCDYKLGAAGSGGSDFPFCTLSTGLGDDYYMGMAKCNLWIEGEDSEARLDMVNGRFTMNLVLSSV